MQSTGWTEDKMARHKRFCPTMAILFLLVLPACFQPPAARAGETSGREALVPDTTVTQLSPIDLFRKFVSRADGDRCPMYPTCSHYASQAFAQKGIVMGWILTCDRLLRCGRDETRRAPKIRVHGDVHTYDPVAANTFWWDTH